jgi:hypothetical protein
MRIERKHTGIFMPLHYRTSVRVFLAEHGCGLRIIDVRVRNLWIITIFLAIIAMYIVFAGRIGL